jgi:protein-tyrosine phosphatase
MLRLLAQRARARSIDVIRADIYWIETPSVGRLAIMARPRAGDWLADEVASWRTAGIDMVVSLLDPDEVDELGLQREPHLCEAHAIEFVSFPIPDRGLPGSLGEAAALSRLMALRINEGKAVAVHCRAGIGRSSLIAACALVCSGVDPDEAFASIEGARGVRVPDTEEQRAWVVDFHDQLRQQFEE